MNRADGRASIYVPRKYSKYILQISGILSNILRERTFISDFQHQMCDGCICIQRPSSCAEACTSGPHILYVSWLVHVVCQTWGIDQGWEWAIWRQGRNSSDGFCAIYSPGRHYVFLFGTCWGVLVVGSCIFSLSWCGSSCVVGEIPRVVGDDLAWATLSYGGHWYSHERQRYEVKMDYGPLSMIWGFATQYGYMGFGQH